LQGFFCEKMNFYASFRKKNSVISSNRQFIQFNR
jgi:hypothetical protein